MIFYLKDKRKIDEISETYYKLNISKTLNSVNWVNGLEGGMFVPRFTLSENDKTNKRKYIAQIKENEMYFVSYLLAQRKYGGHLVLICDEDDDDLYTFDYCKLLCKFIKKKYGIKCFEFTNDITFDMISDSKMNSDGIDRYTLILNNNKNVLLEE